jgi:hypothetical protein
MSERFKTLTRHFFSRFFDKDSIAPGGDERANVVQIIALLTVPGAFVSIGMIADHPLIRSEVTRMWLRSGDRYVFVCYSMIVMGFVMTFKWDSLFPDRRDYLILTPLPISMREFFAAKALALSSFLLSFAVAINICSCVFVPYAYILRDNTAGVLLPSFFAHFAAVMGGAIFMALFFAALQGVLINVMTPSAFRRISPWIQMVSLTILVTVLLITPGLSVNIRLLVESNTRALDYIPLFWFLGIYEVLNPEGTLIPSSNLWAETAVEATLIVGLIFVATYLISYRRYSKKILEGIESDVFREPWHQRAAAWVLNRTVLRHPFQRAAYYFIGRIFARSTKHRLFVAVYGGVGLALTIPSVLVLRRDTDFVLSFTRSGLIEAPLVLSFFVVSGLRAAFNIPYELPANWMFQITSGSDAGEYLKAIRKWVFLRGLVPVYALLALLQFPFFSVGEALFHLSFGLAIALVLTEVFFFKFNKVPFTCSYFPAKSDLAFLAAAYLYGFTLYTFTIGALERWVGESAQRTWGFFVLVAALLFGLALYRRRILDLTLGIVYEDDADPLVRQLNLT